MTIIAERALVLETKKGERVQIKVKLGNPSWIVTGEEAVCLFAIDGMFRDVHEVHGVDPFQALQLAIQTVNILLMNSRKGTVCWPDGTPYEPV